MTLTRTGAGPDGESQRRVIARVVVVIGLLITLDAGWRAAHAPGAYWSAVQVRFLAPQSARNPNALAVSSDSLVTTAGAVGLIVDPAGDDAAEGTVTLTGEGVAHGVSVQLPNSGGQWATNFDDPVLDVQAVGSRPAEVRARMDATLAGIRSALARLQAASSVTPANAITLSESPPSAPLLHQRGSRIRALAATALLGTGLSLAAGAAIRRAGRRRPGAERTHRPLDNQAPTRWPEPERGSPCPLS